MLIAKCEHCGAVEQVPDEYAGKTLECECGHDVVVPYPKPKPKCKMQPIVLFDSTSQAKKKLDTRMPAHISELTLPVNNILYWVSSLYNCCAALSGIVTFFVLCYALRAQTEVGFYIFGMMLAITISCAAFGTMVKVFGLIELNTRVNNELLKALLRHLEYNTKKDA